jgi:hypothetical protein
VRSADDEDGAVAECSSHFLLRSDVDTPTLWKSNW